MVILVCRLSFKQCDEAWIEKGKGQGNEQVMEFTGGGMVICRWIDTLWVSESWLEPVKWSFVNLTLWQSISPFREPWFSNRQHRPQNLYSYKEGATFQSSFLSSLLSHPRSTGLFTNSLSHNHCYHHHHHHHPFANQIKLKSFANSKCRMLWISHRLKSKVKSSLSSFLSSLV